MHVKKRFPGALGLARIPTWLSVVAGALLDANGRFLLQQRPPGKHHAGLWEFPGGKVEAGETPRNALVRELNEELTIRVDPSALVPFAFAQSEPGTGQLGIVIQLYKVAMWRGDPVAEPGAGLGWFTAAEANRLPLPPLDVDLLAALAARDQ